MSDKLLKVILEKLDTQQLELKEIKAKVGQLDNKATNLDDKVNNLDNKVNNLDDKVNNLDNKVNNLDDKVEKMDKTLDYNTQMTKQTLDYAVNVDKHQQEDHRYLTEKLLVHDKEIFHIREKIKEKLNTNF
ncbi:hypothetical protein HUG20_02695 [Salicibibacter cibi]|uniref:t-SNARE coiled-coil homology domain-containing protein n=1 Tax=Salicibibacter cibi TaxID=2743001 RepID=A0A7T7CEC8_9BACI|nr:hypothetical protein [Salicibibacter cibi]QQK78918.1 hypothetical protein HUG20_02695 [Salicibibacter cibi]